MKARDVIAILLLALLFGFCLGFGRAAGHDLAAWLLGAS